MTLRARIAAVFAVALAASPALAADYRQDCTVCRDPLWPSLENLAPGIPVTVPPVADRTATPGEVSFAARLSRAPGVGVAAEGTGGTAYADPLWPSLKQGPAGMTASSTAQPEPAAPAKATPAKAPVVASR